LISARSPCCFTRPPTVGALRHGPLPDQVSSACPKTPAMCRGPGGLLPGLKPPMAFGTRSCRSVLRHPLRHHLSGTNNLRLASKLWE
jgi:hypothetical protein